ncbi:hypothetical protein [Paracraurococcus lichenis]|uniref:DUF3726 domain-containing protein n=1 Tax=Paracraurococcus lichenis TaxID=3064888 RepID=A0ABT9EC86_9PROT|nr:hypothetical protein [Paracraurococcus sp. LOR1-02]MDO9713829.1 hypothetical protein [Paracraurococcus sp. LOR1-02]
MATVVDLVAAWSRTSGDNLPSVRAVARELIIAGVLPKASGRRFPEMQPEHIVRLAFALYGARRIVGAVAAARTLWNLPLDGTPPRHRSLERADGSFAAAPPAGETLTMLLAEHAVLAERGEGRSSRLIGATVEVCATWPEVVITLPAPGGTALFFEPPAPAFDEDGEPRDGLRLPHLPNRRTIIPGNVFASVLASLSAADRARRAA